MSPENQAAIEEAERAGFDLSLLQDSLEATTTERARQHDGALALALALDRVREERDAYAAAAARATR